MKPFPTLCLLALVVASASATAATLTATYTGFYASDGTHSTQAYATGVLGSLGEEHKGYVVFDLSGIAPGTVISSATALLPNPASLVLGGAIDHLATNLYGIPSASYANWASPAVSLGQANFTFIGSPGQFGTPLVSSTSITQAASGTTIPFAFNAAGLQFLANAEGTDFVAFGLDITNLDPNNFYSQYAFDLTGSPFITPTSPPVRLQINTAPEPTSLGLALFGGTLLAARRRR